MLKQAILEHVRIYRATRFAVAMAIVPLRATLRESTDRLLDMGVSFEALELIRRNPAAVLIALPSDAEVSASKRRAELNASLARVKAQEERFQAGGRFSLMGGVE